MDQPMAPVGPNLRAHFAAIPAPRVDRTKRHQWLDIITIAICAVLCGADSWVDVEVFGHRYYNTTMPSDASCQGMIWSGARLLVVGVFAAMSTVACGGPAARPVATASARGSGPRSGPP